MKKSNLILLSILCVAVLLFCILAGCVKNDSEQPTDGTIDDSFFDDSTGDSNDDSTGGSNDDSTGGSTQPSAGGNTSGGIMDDEANNEDYVGVPFA